jgi:hypothetical protein
VREPASWRPLAAKAAAIILTLTLAFPVAGRVWQHFGDTPEAVAMAFTAALRRHDAAGMYDVCLDPEGQSVLPKRTMPPRTTFYRFLQREVFARVPKESRVVLLPEPQDTNLRQWAELHTYRVWVDTGPDHGFWFEVGIIPTTSGFLFRRWRVVGRPTFERFYSTSSKLPLETLGPRFQNVWLASGGLYPGEPRNTDWDY